ncbi:rhomboid family intramembrane serine protease [Cnuibacter sp. UC19_7]|uniref:rhomboid family intramembrane serine protease n=1 Tax=Cnuibacter sp. UC19_7 TaxID=3350166 RepID=UPI00366BA516
MTSLPDSPDNYCYRHPNRQSFVLCQRCGRTICPECQVQAAVGVHCVECARRDRQETPRAYRGSRRPSFLRNLTGQGAPVVTYAIIAVCVLVFILQLIPGLGVTQALLYAPAYTSGVPGIPFEPWRMITSAFVHSQFSIAQPWSILHILLNMYTLFIFGPILERLVGRWRFLALYLVAAFGGSVAVDLLADPRTAVVGASGAIFGLMGAFFIINRHLGGDSAQILVLVGLNLAMGFFISGISWQAHVGGLIAGGLVALVYVRTRRRQQKWVQILLVAAIVAALIAVTAIRTLFY